MKRQRRQRSASGRESASTPKEEEERDSEKSMKRVLKKKDSLEIPSKVIILFKNN